MRQVFVALVLAAALAGSVFGVLWTARQGASDAGIPAAAAGGQMPVTASGKQALPEKAVLDISVQTLEELHVLLDRAEQLSNRLIDSSGGASIVLVLHGPEVEFFSRKNYDRYRDIVDQAARLDAFNIVDVKICQTMMSIKGLARDDIPAFIDQVPDGGIEVERLLDKGYVYF